MSGHSKGKWVYEPGYRCVMIGSMPIAAIVTPRTVSGCLSARKEAEANGRLMAMGSEMVRVLEGVLNGDSDRYLRTLAATILDEIEREV